MHDLMLQLASHEPLTFTRYAKGLDSGLLIPQNLTLALRPFKTVTHHVHASNRYSTSTPSPFYSCSTLPSLLLPTNDLEAWCLFLGYTSSSTTTYSTFLGDFTPATTTILALPAVTRREKVRRRRIGDDAAVSKLTATSKFLGEAAAVNGARGSVDGVGDDLGFGWKIEEGGYKVVD